MCRLLILLLGTVGLSLPAAAPFIGAYDAEHWAGLTLTTEAREGFGFYLEIEKEGQRASGYDIFHIMKRVGPNAGNGEYNRLEIDSSLPFGLKDKTPILDKRLPTASVTWEWSRVGNRVFGKLGTNAPIILYLRFYSPWDYSPRYQRRGSLVRGRCGKAGMTFRCSAAGSWRENNGYPEVKFVFAAAGSVYFCAALSTRGGDPPPPDLSQVESSLAAGLRKYSRQRLQVEGDRASLAEAVVNNLNWMVLLQPEVPALYTPAGRRWLFPAPGDRRDHWTLFNWDSFFNALLLGAESPVLARSAVLAVLRTQYDNGNIPNWRGRFSGSSDRAQPPVGSFSVLKLYRRFADRGWLQQVYPYLKKFNLFWTAPLANQHIRRDGNGNGLLEWGSDTDLLAAWVPEWEKNADGRTRAAWESGQDDLPNYDQVPFRRETGTLELDCVDLNSLFALDCECLTEIAAALGLADDERFFRARYQEARKLINELLWDENAGMYKDRFWDGRLSPRLAASNFYPLLAGIPDANRAARMLKNLLDPGLFWGEYVIPTISRNDPAFSDQQYWRGTIWPPTNYLVCQGLRRYGFYQAAAEMAQKSMNLFLSTWDTFQLCRENYDARSGEGGGQRYQSWGPLFALLGLEDFSDRDIFGRLTIGSLRMPALTRIRNHRDGDGLYDIAMGPSGMAVQKSGRPWLESDAPVVLSGIEEAGGRFTATAVCERPVRIKLTMAGKRFQVKCDGEGGESAVPEASVPEGRHQVLIEKLR
jgi:hypothetical protein